MILQSSSQLVTIRVMTNEVYRCKQEIIKATDYAETVKKARRIYHDLERKRDPFVRSAYFEKDKIFINTFWDHLKPKPQRDRRRRLKFYGCALELIQRSRVKPESPFRTKSENLYRFSGESADGQKFVVQIREESKTGRKYFTSVFPLD